MQTPNLVAAAVLAAVSTGAYAGGGEAQYPPLYQPTATMTREQVRAELAAAIARGEWPVGERGHVFKDEPSTRSRAEVMAEVREARRMRLLFSVAGTPPATTPAQEAQIKAAGRAAAKAVAEAARKVPG